MHVDSDLDFGGLKVGAVILGAAGVGDPVYRGSTGHLTAAGLRCLADAGVSADRVGLIINSGLYRDDNLAEPAISAIVQGRMGINLDYAAGVGNRTLSFDLMNSVCGPINAIGVASAFLASGNATNHALILCGDAHPSGATGPEFPYTTAGSAMLLGAAADPDDGFGRVATLMSASDQPGADGYIDLARGIDLILRSDHDYAQRAAKLAGELIRCYAVEESLDLTNTILVTPELTAGFGALLAAQVGVEPARVAIPHQRRGSPHTAGLFLAYLNACSDGRAATARQLLFVAAGAGVTAVCVVYRPPHECRSPGGIFNG